MVFGAIAEERAALLRGERIHRAAHGGDAHAAADEIDRLGVSGVKAAAERAEHVELIAEPGRAKSLRSLTLNLNRHGQRAGLPIDMHDADWAAQHVRMIARHADMQELSRHSRVR